MASRRRAKATSTHDRQTDRQENLQAHHLGLPACTTTVTMQDKTYTANPRPRPPRRHLRPCDPHAWCIHPDDQDGRSDALTQSDRAASPDLRIDSGSAWGWSRSADVLLEVQWIRWSGSGSGDQWALFASAWGSGSGAVGGGGCVGGARKFSGRADFWAERRRRYYLTAIARGP